MAGPGTFGRMPTSAGMQPLPPQAKGDAAWGSRPAPPAKGDAALDALADEAVRAARADPAAAEASVGALLRRCAVAPDGFAAVRLVAYVMSRVRSGKGAKTDVRCIG